MQASATTNSSIHQFIVVALHFTVRQLLQRLRNTVSLRTSCSHSQPPVKHLHHAARLPRFRKRENRQTIPKATKMLHQRLLRQRRMTKASMRTSLASTVAVLWLKRHLRSHTTSSSICNNSGLNRSSSRRCMRICAGVHCSHRDSHKCNNSCSHSHGNNESRDRMDHQLLLAAIQPLHNQ